MNWSVALHRPFAHARPPLGGPVSGGPHRKRAIALCVAIALTFAGVFAADLIRRSSEAPPTVERAIEGVTARPSPAKAPSPKRQTVRRGAAAAAPVAASAQRRANAATLPSCAASDATALLNQLLASTPNGGTLNLPAGACYRVNGTLDLTGRRNLVIDGNGTTLRAYTQGFRERMFWMLRGASGITIRDFTLIGANPTGVYRSDLEAQHGFAVNGSTDVLIDNVTVKQTYGDGVTFAKRGHGSDAPPDRVVVRNSTFQTIGRMGIGIAHARNVTIAGNYFDRVARSVIDLEPDVERNLIEHITISNNRTGTYGHLFVAGGGNGCGIHHVVIRNNDSLGGAIAIGSPVATCQRSHMLVEGNTFRLRTGTDKGAWAFFLRVDYVTVRNNRIITTRGVPGVRFTDAGGALSVTGNTFSGTCTVTVEENSAHVTVSGNTTATVCPAPPKS